MYLMYYLNENGERVYTLQVSMKPVQCYITKSFFPAVCCCNILLLAILKFLQHIYYFSFIFIEDRSKWKAYIVRSSR